MLLYLTAATFSLQLNTEESVVGIQQQARRWRCSSCLSSFFFFKPQTHHCLIRKSVYAILHRKILKNVKIQSSQQWGDLLALICCEDHCKLTLKTSPSTEWIDECVVDIPRFKLYLTDVFGSTVIKAKWGNNVRIPPAETCRFNDQCWGAVKPFLVAAHWFLSITV